jgi:hypothetical protein
LSSITLTANLIKELSRHMQIGVLKMVSCSVKTQIIE